MFGGTTQPLRTLSVRATGYIVVSSGPAMIHIELYPATLEGVVGTPRPPVILWQTQRTTVSQHHALAHGFAAWTLDIHHLCDPGGKVLQHGTGERRSAERLGL
jgi:hypothetical protein